MTRQTLLLIASLLLTSLLVACGPSPELTPPSGFARLEEPEPYAFRAVSAHGHVIAADVHDNEDENATVEFWANAIEYQKVELDGFMLAKRAETRTNSGVDGVLFHFELGEEGDQLTYVIGVFVTPDHVITVECVGLTEAIATDLDEIEASIQTLTF